MSGKGTQRLQKSRSSGKSERPVRHGHGSKTGGPVQIAQPKEEEPMVSQSDGQSISIEFQQTSTNIHCPASLLNSHDQRKHGEVGGQALQPEMTRTDFEIELQRQIVFLSQQKEEVQEHRDNLLQELYTLKTSLGMLSAENESTQKHNKALKEEVEFLRLDNEKLRTYIVTRERDLNPIHTENFYVQSFQALKGEIEMWIAKQSKANPTTPLLDEDEAKLLGTLATLGSYSTSSSEISHLRHVAKTWCTRTWSRIQLIRHIVAVFLFDQIFSSFAVGLSPELSEVPAWIANHILSHDREFSQILIIHQSIGLGALDYVQKHIKEYETSIIAALVNLLLPLIPKTPKSEIIKATMKFVSKSIAMKHAMTQEQAVYRCYWVNYGDKFDNDLIDVSGDATGPVGLCTFPGLERVIKKDGITSVIPVVKAWAVLQSADAKKYTE